VRNEKAATGQLIHIDIKTLARPSAWATASPTSTPDTTAARCVGYEHLHAAIDGASRLAYTEIPPSLGRQNAVGFLQRALPGTAASA
jgi:hypothetical protein